MMGRIGTTARLIATLVVALCFAACGGIQNAINPAGPNAEAYQAIFAKAGLMVLAYVSGDNWDGLRITIGEPVANARILEIAATLPRPVDR